ncbi:MAG: L-aspartate oxidase [Gammaproteobacteria bacterium]|nr:L-aspartate oxidase [Gammaproteobacteria bacterium]MCF6230548.1 L-aspartate oxidase [Gammaproteobacteria bacterium]
MTSPIQYDALIIGSGASGLSLALHLAQNIKVCVLAKSNLLEGATYYAQGGISAVLDEHDSIQSHINDTQNAGAGLCDEAIVKYTVSHGAEQINWLAQQGMPFTTLGESGGKHYHLTQEGGHSHRRVAHAEDATGRAMESTLESQVHKHQNIDIFEHHIAIDLITSQKIGIPGNRVHGVYVLDRHSQRIKTFHAKTVVLATGGASKVYLYTSNPDVATGDGIAMAWRAGCRVANMEFIQFHPTCLYHPQAKSFLITEALRGEGATLQLESGERFMPRYDERAELAPRDIVARAIDAEMKRLGSDCVYLDITHKPAKFIIKHFPNIHRRCLTFGIDITRERIPVVPAAHYTCGGVMTNQQGQTDIDGLYTIGEAAYTGLHGANRMASNSLLECLVFAAAAAKDICQQLVDQQGPEISLPHWDDSQVTHANEAVLISHNWDELRRCMWDYVGIVRNNKRLQYAKRRINLLRNEIEEHYHLHCVSNDLIELRNLVVIADLIVQCALNRKESRGLHYTQDYPTQNNDAQPQPTILTPPNFDPSQAE